MNDMQLIDQLSLLPADDLAFLDVKAEQIRAVATSAVVEIGRHLIEAKKRVGHGHFLDWIGREFQWTERSAQRYISVYETFGNTTGLSHSMNFTREALYLLAGPTVPEQVRQQAIEQAETGDRITKAEAQKLIDEAREQATAEVHSEYDGKLHLTEKELAGHLTKIAKKFDAKIERISKDRDKLNDRLLKAHKTIQAMQEAVHTKNPDAEIAQFDSTTSFRAMCISQAAQALREELKITPRQLVDIEREMATRIHQQPELAVAKLAKLQADARPIVEWLSELIAILGEAQ